LFLQGDDPASLGPLKSKVELVALGELLRDNGDAIVWDSFFTSDSGHIFIDNLNVETTVFVTCDTRLRNVHISGSIPAVEEARQRVLWHLDMYKKDRRVITLRPQSLRHFVRGGLQTLQEALGKDNIWLNVVDLPLVFRCPDDKVPIVRRAANASITDTSDYLLPTARHMDMTVAVPCAGSSA
jgi:hypothetical protein